MLPRLKRAFLALAMVGALGLVAGCVSTTSANGIYIVTEDNAETNPFRVNYLGVLALRIDGDVASFEFWHECNPELIYEEWSAFGYTFDKENAVLGPPEDGNSESFQLVFSDDFSEGTIPTVGYSLYKMNTDAAQEIVRNACPE